MTMTVGARSLDNEERSNFRDYMSLLSLSVDASMTVREVMAVAYLIGRHDALRDVRNASSPARTVNRRLIRRIACSTAATRPVRAWCPTRSTR
mgnify:CR=1 FL=1